MGYDYTTHGIRHPGNESDYADIKMFLNDLAVDVDTKFVPLTGAASTLVPPNPMTGPLQAANFISSNGGISQSSTVLQTSVDQSKGYSFYDDNQKYDNSAGRRLWIAGPHGSDVAIATRSGSELLNKIVLKAGAVEITGAVNIAGTLNVTQMKTITQRYEGNFPLANPSAGFVRITNAPGFTFTCPPSGRVVIGYGGQIPTRETFCALSYQVREGGNIGVGNIVLPTRPAHSDFDAQPPPQGISANGVSSGGVQWVSAYTAFLLGGADMTGGWQSIALQPGATYNIETFYWNKNSGGAAMKIYRHYFIVTPDL